MESLNEKRINSRFFTTEWLTRGGFGTIFRGFDKKKEEEVAVKLLLVKEVKKGANSPDEELKIHRLLQNIPGVVNMRSGGNWHVNDMHIKFIIMDLAQSSLEAVCKTNVEGKDVAAFSERTTALVGIQLMEAIREIHSKGFLHRDLKCENFLFFPLEVPVVKICDFGVSTRFRDRMGRRVAPSAYPENFPRLAYCSLGVAKNMASCEVDDIWQLGYALLRMRAYHPFAKMSVEERLKLKEQLAMEPEKCLQNRQEFLRRFLKLIGKQVRNRDVDYDGLISKLDGTIRKSRRDTGKIPMKKEKGQWKMM